MIYYTTTCQACGGTGRRDYRWRCRKCVGTGKAVSGRRGVSIGLGWFDASVALSYEQRHDVAMLAACLGSPVWPPEAR